MPLRSPRPAKVGIVIGLAAASVVLGSVPALADSVRLQEWWLGKLDVSQAWQSSRGAGITVAVLGDGVDASQDDLAGSVITGPDYTSSGRTSGGSYFGLEGTAAASLIAGHGHGAGRSDGVIGVAPAARILSVRVILSPGDPLLASTATAAARPGAIATAIRYAVGHGAGVIDLPLDPGQPTIERASAQAAAGGSAAEKAAVAYALSKGVVLVAPAGDNGAGNDAVNYPAAYPGVISVGAFNQDFMKAPYSSHQPYVSLTAAGAGMIVAAPDGYTTMSSTAAASAVVAGMAALIRSRYPALTPAEVSRALTHSTKIRPVGGRTDGSGYGTADAAAAMHTASVLAARVRQGASPAAPRTDSASPALAKADNSAPHVLRAVVISAGILVLLLMMIAAYAAAQRRRARRAAAAAAERDRPGAERDRPGADRFASVGAGDADPMQAFFSAPMAGLASQADAGTAAGRRPAAGHSRPGGSRPQAAHGGRGGHGGHGGPGGHSGLGHGGATGPGGPGGPAGFAANGRPGASAPFAAASEPPGPGGINGASSSAADRTARPARTPAIEPAPRPASRRPKVSGTPPWEPAAKPDSELPWATSPAPHAVRMPGPAAPRPAAPRGPAAPRPAGPGPAGAGPDPAWNVPPAPWNAAPTANAAPMPPAGGDSVWDLASRSAADSGAQGGHGTGTDPGGSQDQGSRPIYVWNPAASTESFPAVPEDGD